MKDYITYLKFDDFSEEELFSSFSVDVSHKSKKIIVTPNLDDLRIAYKNSLVRNCINNADYSTIDGKPILGLAKKEHKKNFKYKISGSDMIVDLLPLANKNHWSMVIFGGKEGVAELAKKNVEAKYPNIDVRGTFCPEFGYEKNPDLTDKYIQEINQYHADLILLCTGFPKSEMFYFSNKEKFGPGLYFCVGATVDFLAGNIKRAPKWMSKVGLEWLYRLSKDFKRLFKRYWKDGWFLIHLRWMMTFNKKKITKLKVSE